VNIAPNFDKNNIQLLFQTARVGGPGFVYLRDKRNSQLSRQKEQYVLDVSWLSRYFASEADFARMLIQNSTYHAIGKKGMVFARSTRLGFEETFHNTVCRRPTKTFWRDQFQSLCRKGCLPEAPTRTVGLRSIKLAPATLGRANPPGVRPIPQQFRTSVASGQLALRAGQSQLRNL